MFLNAFRTDRNSMMSVSCSSAQTIFEGTGPRIRSRSGFWAKTMWPLSQIGERTKLQAILRSLACATNVKSSGCSGCGVGIVRNRFKSKKRAKGGQMSEPPFRPILTTVARCRIGVRECFTIWPNVRRKRSECDPNGLTAIPFGPF